MPLPSYEELTAEETLPSYDELTKESLPSYEEVTAPVEEAAPSEQLWGGIRGDASVLAGQSRPSPDIPGSGVIRGGILGSTPPPPPEQFDPNNPEHARAALQSQAALETFNTMMLPFRADWFDASTDEERARAAGQAEVDKLETRRALDSFTPEQRNPSHPDYESAVGAARAYTAAKDRSDALNARIASVQPGAVAEREAAEKAQATEQQRREFMGETNPFIALLSQAASYPLNVVGGALQDVSPTLGSELMRGGQQFKETASRAPGATGAIARGVGDVGGLMLGGPSGAIKASISATVRGAQDAYAQTLLATGSEEQADQARLKAARDMLAYMAVGTGASRAVQAALPAGTTPFRAAVLSGTGAAGANVATSFGMAAARGEEYGLQQLTADLVMGGVEGVQTGKRVKAEQADAPPRPSIEQPPVSELVVPSETVPTGSPETAEGIVPAIRVGEQVVKGNTGETHQDILNRFRAENPEQAADAIMDFDSKQNPNFFVDAAGNEISRAELQEKFGVSDSQGLTELQQQSAERRLGPGAANIEEPLAEGFPTSNKEEVVNEERAVQWKDPIVKEASIGNEEAFARARQILEQNPTRGLEIAQRLNSQGPHERTISFEDSAIMVAERVRVKKQRAAEVEKSIDPNLSPEERAAAKQRAEEMSTQLESLDSATQGARSTWGRFGQFWQRLVNEDYTFAEMVNTARLKKGEELTEAETRDVKSKADRFQKAKETFEAKVEEAEVGQPIDDAIRAIEAEASKDPEFEPQVRSLAERISNRLQKAADAALTRLRAKGFLQLGSAPDPTILADLVIYGAAKITKGALDFGRWGTSMIRDLGRGVEPFLKDIWTKANQQIDKDAGAGGKNKAKVKDALTKTKTVATVDEIGAGMKSKGGKISEMRGDIQKLVETLVRGGIKQREPLVDAVHEVLKGIDPSITRRQTMDAISGYGDFKPLNKDAVKAEVRDIKQQLQLVAKIQDIQSKIPLQKSGIERQKLSDESRRLTAELNENIKKFGVVVSDPATQLRTILAAQETRLTNRIKDLRAEIASGTRRVKSKTDRPSNKKIDALKKELAEVEAEHAAIFGKREITQEQKVKAAVAAAKRTEAAETARLEKAKKGIFDKPPKTPAIRTAEIDAIKARIEAARAERKALEEAANPKKTKEQIALQNFKARAARKIAELQDRMTREDFTTRPRKPLDVSKDPEAVKAQAEMERVKKEFQQKKFEWEQRNRHWLRKGVDSVKETLAASRSLITSADVSAPFRQGGFLMLGDLVFHPVRAAKQLGTMFKQLVSEKAFEEAQAQIMLRPNARNGLYDRAKLYLADLSTKLTAREENMKSTLAERIPIIGRLVRASNRAYSGFLNRQRADAFDAMVEVAGGADAITPESARFLAEAVNTLTGRGSVGAQNEGAANFLARYLFSPRFLASRFQTVLGKPVLGALGKGVTLRDRQIVAQQYAKFAIGLAALYGLAKLAGGEVEKDPRSSDFGKIRFKNTRVDPLAGLAQVTTLMARVATQKVKRNDGTTKPFDADVLYQFARSKLAPIPGALVDVTTGKNVVGQKVTPGSVAMQLTVPISYQDMGELYRKQGPIRGTVLSVLNLLGMGVNTYGKR